ncbi:hypothetical protein THARTR1_04816 [Trichoderma harzianum]|uniref:Uncharacterized protein n=1 Tax=Trichoderma harzianum TaxID=5544 RepID=A0A2K0UBH2_TRIHA|nr:hypothetical protein THARTR1_04816 [Trichoderma harzianum]
MRKDHRLKEALDIRRIDEVLVSYTDHGYDFCVQDDVNLDQPQLVLVTIACMYKLIKANPSRFTEPTVGVEKDECVWGIHHEDWQRAYAVIFYVKYRREYFARCPNAGQAEYMRAGRAKVDCFAYATPDVIAAVAARQGM